MNKYLFFIFFILLFSSVFADDKHCLPVNKYYGCSIDNPSLWECSGKMVTRICSSTTGLCSGSCKITSSYITSTTDCTVDFHTNANTQSIYFFSTEGKLVDGQLFLKYKDTCAYGLCDTFRYNYECVDWGFLHIWCNQWKTFGTYECQDVICAGTSTLVDKTCTMNYTVQNECNEINTGSCDKAGFFCQDGSVTKCDSYGAYFTTEQCEKQGLVCLASSKTTAVCVNQTERDEANSCTPDNSKRCNPDNNRQIDICTNSVWGEHKTCLMACNSTGLASSSTDCVDHNIDVSGCTNFETFCYDIGSRAYFYICENNDWVLRSTCQTARCNNDSSDCYEGCKYLSSMFYSNNNTGYYCNELGEWIRGSECVGVINNVTMQCDLPEVCATGTITCNNNWIVECVNEEWRYIEQCTFGCQYASCKSEGADIFTQVSWGADFLALVLPFLSIFISLILLANTIGYLVKQIMNKAVIWIKGKPQ